MVLDRARRESGAIGLDGPKKTFTTESTEHTEELQHGKSALGKRLTSLRVELK